jgi:hypothetical protein
MDQIFHLAKNKSSKFTLLKHAYFNSFKSSKHAKMSTIVTQDTKISIMTPSLVTQDTKIT